MLTSLPMFGEAQVASLYLDGEDKKWIEALKNSLSKSKHLTNKAMYLLWARYFDEGDGMNSPYQVDAFLAISYRILYSRDRLRMVYTI